MLPGPLGCGRCVKMTAEMCVGETSMRAGGVVSAGFTWRKPSTRPVRSKRLANRPRSLLLSLPDVRSTDAGAKLRLPMAMTFFFCLRSLHILTMSLLKKAVRSLKLPGGA